jgi:hypothetical protein
VITTSLDKDEVSAAQVVRYYRSLQNVEHRFRVLKDFLNLRPIFHWTEGRVRGHVALCVLAATIEAVMAKDLVNAKVMDPDLPFQSMTPRRALSLLKEIRLELVSAGDHNIELVSRRSALQAKVLRKPSKSTPRPGTRPQSPEQGIHLTRSGNTFPARCHLPGMTRKSRQTPVGPVPGSTPARWQVTRCGPALRPRLLRPGSPSASSPSRRATRARRCFAGTSARAACSGRMRPARLGCSAGKGGGGRFTGRVGLPKRAGK